MVVIRGSVPIGPALSRVTLSSMSIVKSMIGAELAVGDTSSCNVAVAVDVDPDVDVGWTSANLLSSEFGASPCQMSLLSSNGKESITTSIVVPEGAAGDFVDAENDLGASVAGLGEEEAATVAIETMSGPGLVMLALLLLWSPLVAGSIGVSIVLVDTEVGKDSVSMLIRSLSLAFGPS